MDISFDGICKAIPAEIVEINSRQEHKSSNY
jgi:hypothetical protein